MKFQTPLRSYVALIFMLIATCALSAPTWAVDIPTGLTQNELDDVARILGFNTSTKFLTNPYPLGGYTGLEFGASLEIINTEELKLLGDANTNEDELRYTRISVGKGLFNNTDVFIHFVPYSRSNQISEFGGLLRWAFYEGAYLPFTVSTLFHVNTIEIQDSFVSQSTGTDLLLGVNVNRFALYFGGGYLRTGTEFTKSILDAAVPLSPENTFKETFTTGHSFVGLHFEFFKLFLAAQIDRYKDPVYSIKLGTRL